MTVHDSEIQEQIAQKILIVDDNPDNLSVLKTFLNGQGYRLFFASSGEQALQSALAVQPHLILLDIKMPGMDGFDVCRHLKEQDQTKDIPVIFATSSQDSKDITRAYHAGGVDYISKPLQFEEVSARVNTQLQIQSLFQEQEQRRQLDIKSAYVAGKTYIIGNTLHHLGNLLNGVMGSVDHIRTLVNETEVQTIGQLLEVIDQDFSSDDQHANSAHPLLHTLRPLLVALQETLEHESQQILRESVRVKERLANIERLFHMMRDEEKHGDLVEIFSLKDAVCAAMEFVSLSMGEHGYRMINTVEDSLTIRGNRSELVNVLMSLLTNAIEAIRNQDIEVGQVLIDTIVLPRESESSQYRVRLQMKDNGGGMTEQQLSRVFVSGFTTKADHQGLSLHWSSLAISQIGGRLTVTTQTGQGCTFVLELPIAGPVMRGGGNRSLAEATIPNEMEM